MLRYLDDALEKVLPDDQYARLTAHDAEIAATTAHGDFHRCLRCAEWAVELCGRPEHSQLDHLTHALRAVLHEARETGWAVKFGVNTPGRTVTDVELTWVDEAVAVAAAAAATSGWAKVPWESLLEELIALEP